MSGSLTKKLDISRGVGHQPAFLGEPREIEGKRCWFVRAGGAMPPKSAFTWAKEEPIKEDVPAAPEKTKTGPSIQMLRVKPVTPEEMSEVRANWLNDHR